MAGMMRRKSDFAVLENRYMELIDDVQEAIG